MDTGAITQYVDVAQLVLYAFCTSSERAIERAIRWTLAVRTVR